MSTHPDPIAWEVKSHNLKHHLTNEQYWKLSSKVRQWYRPYTPPVPTCRCCGTTENLHADNGSGGPFRCDSPDCMVF